MNIKQHVCLTKNPIPYKMLQHKDVNKKHSLVLIKLIVSLGNTSRNSSLLITRIIQWQVLEDVLHKWHLLLKAMSRTILKIDEEGSALAVICMHPSSEAGLLMVRQHLLQGDTIRSYSQVRSLYRVHSSSPLISLLWKSQ